ncbi:hypothetical protein PG993_007987 [Apiospora rasikravindrae]|uniref:Uncharacterized protein n=1 Tax=Apiospora rasikravindrae TaxID=990691 RepID=A0ABR1T0G8_9PEZI
MPPPTGTGTGGTDAPSSGSASSQAWVAGAVAGPIVGCALVSLLVWWIMRRRMKKAMAAAPGPPAMQTAESGRGVSSMYSQNQTVQPWPTSTPTPPSHGTSPGHGWEARNKPSSLPPVPGATPGHPHELPNGSLNELSNVPESTDHNGAVYEMHHGGR